jgi:excisionase family DNA binding protein
LRLEIDLALNGVVIPAFVTFDEEALAALGGALPAEGAKGPSKYMTILEAADFLRCARQRVDDLLSQGRLTRLKDGTRTLISRDEVEQHLRAQRR